jgi:hypothetical protein
MFYKYVLHLPLHERAPSSTRNFSPRSRNGADGGRDEPARAAATSGSHCTQVPP